MRDLGLALRLLGVGADLDGLDAAARLRVQHLLAAGVEQAVVLQRERRVARFLVGLGQRLVGLRDARLGPDLHREVARLGKPLDGLWRAAEG